MDADDTATSHFLRNVIDSVADPIFVKDDEHRLIEFNRAFREQVGLTREQLLGKTDYELFPRHEADVFREKDQDALRSMRESVNEETITDAQGVMRTISTKRSAFVGADGRTVLVGVIRDITSLREAERRDLEMTQRLATSAKFAALGEMAGGIAHEINTPLAIIQGLADELLDMAEDGGFDRGDVLRLNDEITTTVERVSKIISGLRAFARDGRKDEPDRVTLEALASETLALCRENLEVLGIPLELSGSAGGVLVSCRSTQIVQILLNLLNNARDAVAGTPSPRIELRMDRSDDDDEAQLSVIDSGPGIPPQLRERIMEPFFTSKPVGEGTGIGLSIAKGLAEDNGGTLTLDVEHPNTCFVLRLPRADPGDTGEEDEP